MDMDDKAGLVQFLINQKPSKKRGISEVSPVEAAESLPRPPLVEVHPQSSNIPATTQPTNNPGTLYFVLEGRAGKVEIPRNRLLTVSML